MSVIEQCCLWYSCIVHPPNRSGFKEITESLIEVKMTPSTQNLPPGSPSTFEQHPDAQDVWLDNSPAHSVEDSEDFQPSPVRFTCKSRTGHLPSTGDEDDQISPNHSQHTSSPKRHRPTKHHVSFYREDSTCSHDEDGDEDADDEDDPLVDGRGGSVDDIKSRRHKFRNEEIDEVVNMFNKFQEEKLKPCAKCLGCTISRLMRIGKWALNTPERRM